MAAPLPSSTIPFATEAQAMVKHEQGLRFVDAGQLHCTLAFIGSAGHDKEQAAREVVSGLSPESGGEAAIDGFLCLPDRRRPRVVALGIDDVNGVLGALYESVMAGLEAEGVMQRESRPFRPHVTIARLRSPHPLQPTSDCGRVVFGVESVCLYESELRSEGAVHSVLERTYLQKANGLTKA